VLTHPKLGAAVVEFKGKAKSAAESDSAQLEKWVTEYHLENGVHPKGILVVNAWRDKPLPDRSQAAFPNQMLGYAEARGHCLVTGMQLLGAWLDVEKRSGRAIQIARALFKCSGRFGGYGDWAEFIETRETHEVPEAVAESNGE
jgi:hypothetical protein